MASTLHDSIYAMDQMADYLATALNGGTLKLMDGTQPPSAENAITTQATICTFSISSPAQIAGITNGTITFQLPSSVTSLVSTTASWYRVYTSAGTSFWDGGVATSGADMSLNSVSISLGALVSISSWSRTVK